MITVRATRTCCALVIAAAGLAAAAAPTFELFRGLLTWHVVSGTGWDSHRPCKLLS